MNLQGNNPNELDKTALEGLRRLAAAFNGGEEKPNAAKVAVMFMATSLVKTDSSALTAGFTRITKENIAHSIETLQAMNTFFNEMVEALDALKEMKPPQGY